MTQRPSNADVDLSAEPPDAAEWVRLALSIIAQEIERKPPPGGGGARAALATIREPAFKTKVAKAVLMVQRMKATDKGEWTRSFRYGALSPRHRALAAKIAAALTRLRAAIRPLETDPFSSLNWELRYIEAGDVIDFPMSTDEMEKWRRHFQSIVDTKVRAGSRFDGRKGLAVKRAADLLLDLGLPLSRTRHGAFDQLSATLWGEPDADFSHYLGEYAKMLERLRLKRLEREAERAASRQPRRG